MKYTSDRLYRDSLIVEVDKIIKNLDEKKSTKKNWWVFFVKYIKNIYKKLL